MKSRTALERDPGARLSAHGGLQRGYVSNRPSTRLLTLPRREPRAIRYEGPGSGLEPIF